MKQQQAVSFSSLVSHEIRTPLNSAIFFLRLILTMIITCPELPEQFSKALKRHCDCMQSQLTLSLTFVDDMLDLSQIGAGVFSLTVSDFDPNNVFKMIQEIFQPQANSKNIELTATTTYFLNPPNFVMDDISAPENLETKLPRLLGDERRLKQVLINLVRNSLKFTKRGAIRVQASYNPIEQ